MPEAGLEPAQAICPHEPESCASANSATPANPRQVYISTLQVSSKMTASFCYSYASSVEVPGN